MAEGSPRSRAFRCVRLGFELEIRGAFGYIAWMAAHFFNSAVFVSISMVFVLGCSEPADWSARPLVPQEGAADNLKFRWTVPEGMKRDPTGAGFALRGADDGQPSPRLRVMTERALPPTLAAAIKAARLADAVVSRKDEIPGGFVVSGHSEKKDQILVNVWREYGGAAIRCQASYAGSKGIPSFEKMLSMLEAICLSVGASE